MLPQTRRHTQGWLHLELYNNARSHTYSTNLYRCINSLAPKPIHSAAPSRERRSRSWGYCNDRHRLFFLSRRFDGRALFVKRVQCHLFQFHADDRVDTSKHRACILGIRSMLPKHNFPQQSVSFQERDTAALYVCMYVCMFAHFRPRSCYIQIYNKLSFVLLGLFLFLPGHAPYCRTMKQEMMMYMYCTYLGHLHLQNARCQWKQDRYEITVAQWICFIDIRSRSYLFVCLFAVCLCEEHATFLTL